MHHTEMLDIVSSGGSNGDITAEGCHRLCEVMILRMESGELTEANFSMRNLALSLGVMDPYDEAGSIRRNYLEYGKASDRYNIESLFRESNPGVGTNAFQVITSEFLGRMTIEGYNQTDGMIADQLMQTVTVRKPGQKIPGVKALGGPTEVREGYPYEETGTEEKYVTAEEFKFGRILSINEEVIMQDETGLVAMRARDMGGVIRQEKERFQIRMVLDAETGNGKYVYRPLGTGTALYATDGSLKNWVGSGGVTGYNAAVALVDWESIDTVLNYRATKVTDDRIDGTSRPIAGLNSSRCVLLVPEELHSVALIAAGKISQFNQLNTNVANNVNRVGAQHANPVAGRVGDVLTSPFVSEVSSVDWHYGDFKRQFVWTEMMPVQSFFQGRDSEAAFDRDVVFRVKMRYKGGVSAKDTVYVTKVDGA